MRARLLVAVMALASAQSRAQNRDEAAMFGQDDGADAGSAAVAVPTAPQPSSDVFPPSRDDTNLSAAGTKSRFDTGEEKSDSLRIGANLNIYGQGYWRANMADGAFSTPFIMDAYLDGRPTERLRGFVGARLQFDPTRQSGSTSQPATVATAGSLVGLTQATQSNPVVALDQLWLKFDIARKLFVTLGRQKVRWGVARIWYPTDFLNSRPRDPLNPFDIRLGVDMVKVHFPIESLGWNFYAFGLLDAINIGSTGITFGQLGGALRAEFVFGPAEIGLGAVWQGGREGRYAADVSSSLGPFDVYAEIALRDRREFAAFDYPADLSADNFVNRLGEIHARTDTGVLVQVSGGLTWQFNYTDTNAGVLTAEYFFNQGGYTDPIGYQVQSFAPSFLNVSLDSSQSIPLYQGQHNLAVSLLFTSFPRVDWISATLSNIIIINDPSALTRIDVTFRVLKYLNIQVFAAALYGQTGGQLRFTVSQSTINALALLSNVSSPGSGTALRANLQPLINAPIAQAGVLLRLSI